MQGFQVTFFTGENRRHGHQPVPAWLMELARSLGISGIATLEAAQANLFYVQTPLDFGVVGRTGPG